MSKMSELSATLRDCYFRGIPDVVIASELDLPVRFVIECYDLFEQEEGYDYVDKYATN